MVYHDRRGDLDCWELCLEELCQAFAQDKAMRTPGRAAVVSMVLGAWVDAATKVTFSERSYAHCSVFSAADFATAALSIQKYNGLARVFGPTEIRLVTADTIIGTPLTGHAARRVGTGCAHRRPGSQASACHVNAFSLFWSALL